MCCFSRPVESVTDTKIFARSHADGRQLLVYRMKLSTAEENAMILPLPVKPGTDEKGLLFVDLSGCPDFFVGLNALFPAPGDAGGPFAADILSDKSRTLEVQKVGSFEASFVPSLADFTRLDERFRIAPAAWEKLPQYRDWGFAVFKLAKGRADIHPMAFAFPRRDPARLFFPTVHIHDGQVHEEEEFDHVLYCQRLPEEKFSLMDWEESASLPHTELDLAAARGIVHPKYHIHRRTLRGKLRNEDIVLA